MKRLDILASLVNTKNVFDVGCDHGLLAIALSKKHHVVASDISASSVEKAKANILASKADVEVIQSDGLENLAIKKNDTVVIAGMGTYTILNILYEYPLKRPNTLIIQANNNHDILRKNITSLGYYIDREVTFYDKKWYVIIRFKKGKKEYTNMQYLLGPNPSKEYLKFNLNLYQRMYKKIPRRYFVKRFRIKKIIKEINKLYKK